MSNRRTGSSSSVTINEHGEIGVGHVLLAALLIAVVGSIGNIILSDAKESAEGIGRALTGGSVPARPDEPSSTESGSSLPLLPAPISFETVGQTPQTSVPANRSGPDLERPLGMDHAQWAQHFAAFFSPRSVNEFARTSTDRVNAHKAEQGRALERRREAALAKLDERAAAFQQFQEEQLQQWLAEDTELQRLLDDYTASIGTVREARAEAAHVRFTSDVRTAALAIQLGERDRFGTIQEAKREAIAQTFADDSAALTAEANETLQAIEKARASRLDWLEQDPASRQHMPDGSRHAEASNLILAAASGGAIDASRDVVDEEPPLLAGRKAFAERAEERFPIPELPPDDTFADSYTREDLDFKHGIARDWLRRAQTGVREEFRRVNDNIESQYNTLAFSHEDTATVRAHEAMNVRANLERYLEVEHRFREAEDRLDELRDRREDEFKEAPRFADWSEALEHGEYDPTDVGLTPENQTEVFREEARQLFPPDLRTGVHDRYVGSVDRTEFPSDIQVVKTAVQNAVINESTALRMRHDELKKTIEAAYDAATLANAGEPFDAWTDQEMALLGAKEARLDALFDAYTETAASISATGESAHSELLGRLQDRESNGTALTRWRPRITLWDGSFEP